MNRTNHGKTLTLCYSALMCALLIVSTLWFKFTLPGTDVLVTTQIFFVLLCGQLLPVRHCFYAIGLYLAIGLMGVPVFSAASGPAVLATPSFGYLLGFPFGAMLTSRVNEKMRGHKSAPWIASLLGLLVIYGVALAYIALLKGAFLAAPLPFSTLLSSYCLVFLPMDFIKAILAAALGKRLRKLPVFS